MDKPDDKGARFKGESDETNPFAMCMGMAKKMMSQMGAGESPVGMGGWGPMGMGGWGPMGMGRGWGPAGMGAGGFSPMEMMRKMMAQMRTGEDKAESEPELQQAFNEWMKRTEDEALNLIGEGAKDAAALANALKISEESARHIIRRLAEQGKINLTASRAQ